jgi:hypothetical protein
MTRKTVKPAIANIGDEIPIYPIGALSYLIKRKAWNPKEREGFLDKANHTCAICHKQFPSHLLAIDHIHPVVKGGQDRLDNYQVLCKICNTRKITTDKKQPQKGVQFRFNRGCNYPTSPADLLNTKSVLLAARMAGVSHVDIFRWIREGTLQARPHGSSYIFTKDDVRAFTIKKCSNCYHEKHEDGSRTCGCREISDIEDGCKDWVWRYDSAKH